MRVRGDSTSN
uniref:Uncharacterized protein n=1 Tax=Anguilla anguilla TaxID=7936 RepID=A0A0E9R831_ANGAN